MIKAILFDFDGVLTIDKYGSESIINYIASHAEVSKEKFEKSYYKYNKDLLYGKYTHEDIWKQLCNDIGVDIDFNLLHEAFINTKLDDDMIFLVKELKKSYKIGMITDNKKDRIDDIRMHYNFDLLFDVISVSAEYKSGKSKKDIFEGTINSLNVKYNECIFIDNTKENLKIPEKYGMKTILFDDEKRNIESFKKELYKIL